MVAPALIGAGVGAGLGLLQYQQQRGAANRDRILNAEIARQSPWTGMQARTQFQDPSLMGSVAQGGLKGAQFGMQDFFNPAEGAAAAPAAPEAGGADLYESPQRMGMGGQMEPMSPETNAFYGADYGPPAPGAPAPTGAIADEGFYSPQRSVTASPMAVGNPNNRSTWMAMGGR
jgi:hypothetical protein